MGRAIDAAADKYSVTAIADDIREKILNRTFEPDEKLVEVALCRNYNVSRTPVREAFRLLENEGLVVHTTNRGVRVASISLEDVAKAMEITQELYCISARYAAARITAEEIAQLREINETLLHEPLGPGRNKLDYAFHTLIVRCADNKPLEEHCKIVDRNSLLIDQMLPIRDTRIPYTHEEHERIIDALEAHDAELAAEYMKIHYVIARRSVHSKIAEYNAEVKQKKKKSGGKAS